MPEKQKYLVTRVETVTVSARNEAEAEFLGREKIAYGWPDTVDIQAEVIGGGEPVREG